VHLRDPARQARGEETEGHEKGCAPALIGMEPKSRPIRIGFLVPPGNPTVEIEMIALAPKNVSVHFTRMFAQGAAGSHAGLEERTRMQIAHLSETVRLLAMVSPKVIVMAHTAMSSTLGKEGEAEIVPRMQRESGIPFVTAFGSTVAALENLGTRRVALGTPYDAGSTAKTKALLEAHGIEVVHSGMLENVKNIYDETAERAYGLARKVDVPQAQTVFLSGVGMPTIATLEKMERDLGKPVVSAAAAMMWNALRVAGVTEPVRGFGRLLELPRT
jgi:maleate isomerase